MDPEPFHGTARFEVRRCLGSGGSGTVYEAFDRKRNSLVALKVLREQSAERIYGFKQEFRSLCELNHPNLVTLYELISEQGQWFFTMELVRASDFLAFVGDLEGEGALVSPSGARTYRSVCEGELGEDDDSLDSLGAPDSEALPGSLWRPLSMERLIGALQQLASGLVALHLTGKVHCDIKPANILCTRDGRVVILDVGIARDMVIDLGDESPAFSGTPQYMAPEQVLNQGLTGAADWYSVGAVLYEALTGSPPFAGSASQVMRQKTSHDPPPPSTRRPGVPAALDALCMRLLSRSPGERPTGEQVLAMLAEIDAEPEAPRSPQASTGPGEGPFVGRATHLAALLEAYEDSVAGKAVVVLCHGGSGAGKSTLCNRFVRALAHRDERVVVLTGRCYEHENVPFKALDGVIDALSRFLRRPRSEASALLPREVGALARLFPILDRVPAIENAPRREVVDPAQTRYLAFGALHEVIMRLSDRRPIVLLIDDLQWGDLDSISALLEIVRPPAPPPLLLVVSYRSDEEASSAPLLALREGLRGEAGRATSVRDLPVGELSDGEAQELALVVAAPPLELEPQA